MRIALIGRTQMLHDSALALVRAGHEIGCVLTAPAAPEYTRTEADFERLAARLGCPYLCARSAASPAALALLSGCDIGVSMNWVGVLGPEVLGLFPLGVLNAHPGELPRYRGNACQAWAILRGEERLALTIHVMRPGELDCGRVVHQEYLPLTPEVANAQVWAWLETAVPQGFVAALGVLGRDPGFSLYEARADDPAGFRGYPRLPVDGYIDWTRSTQDIAQLVRAAGPPLPGAYTYADLGGPVDNIIVLEARPLAEPFRDLAVPG
ncbi:MAG: formyltransferase family protein [Humidesulfovibrio sp.]|nr:formyltransferase family protein [Humidesulfovibrio sp.]